MVTFWPRFLGQMPALWSSFTNLDAGFFSFPLVVAYKVLCKVILTFTIVSCDLIVVAIIVPGAILATVLYVCAFGEFSHSLVKYSHESELPSRGDCGGLAVRQQSI